MISPVISTQLTSLYIPPAHKNRNTRHTPMIDIRRQLVGGIGAAGCSSACWLPLLLTAGVVGVLIFAYSFDIKPPINVEYSLDFLFACYMMVLVTLFVGLLMKKDRALWVPKKEAAAFWGKELEAEEKKKNGDEGKGEEEKG
jgi:hypothetical protein